MIIFHGENLGGKAARTGKVDRARELLDSAPACLIAVDKDMKVETYNRASSELFNSLGVKAPAGMDISSIFPDEPVLKMLAEAVRGKTLKLMGYRFEKSRPEERYFDLTVAPLKDGAALMAVDSTERCQAMKNIEAARAEAEFYVDLMSHDIRNFNQVTMGYIELLQLTNTLSDTERSYLEKAQRGVTGSNRLIDNIKKVRLIRQFAGKSLSKMDLSEILVKDAEDVRKASQAAKVTLEFDANEKRHVVADDYIHEIFRHIMENAVKYDPHPEKLIEVKAKPEQKGDKKYWSVSIADHGAGIPEEKKKSIFERMTKTTKGAGVGLSIVNVLVHKYGGDIYVEDRVKGDPSQGSVFTVELPQA
jgi:signal transduction histidine kinase